MPTVARAIKVFAIYQIILVWKTNKYELPNPRPTQPKKNSVKSGIWVTFFPSANNFSWVGIGFYIGNRPEEILTQLNSPQTPYVLLLLVVVVVVLVLLLLRLLLFLVIAVI